MWTFGKKIAVGFTLSGILLLAIGSLSYRSIEALADTRSEVEHSYEVLGTLAALLGALNDAETGQRGYIIVGRDEFLEPYNQAASQVASHIKRLRALTADNAIQLQRIDRLEPLAASRFERLQRGIQLRREKGAAAGNRHIALGDGKEIMDQLRELIGQMEDDERALLKARAESADSTVSTGEYSIVFGTLACLLLAVVAGYLITRSLSLQIGTAVGHVQSSSTELQAAANQQATGAKEQATAMNEITTTISELLATSRQIAESAQRVAQIAAQTAGAAQSGDKTVATAQESIAAIRHQVDMIVSNMLELGRKSQQIGAVLDIVSELAEQTNILAINASIEAAGAGEAGRRFSVVAEEIRKLADRVSGSAKEIRMLIDEVRSAVNTTVMTTETGSKAVDSGSRQFEEVAAVFKQIASLVSTTTEAAREIELSTKQQATAVEQVNVAIANVAQASRETEASSSQTLQTSSQLTSLSRDLLRLVRPQTSAA